MSIEQTRRNGKTNWKWKVRNYLPNALQRAHVETVTQVVTLWQGLVCAKGHDWLTNRKPLVAPELKKERTAEKDRLRRTTLQHPRAHPPVRARKNRVGPTDLGHDVKGVSAILRAWGIRYVATASPCELQNNTNPNNYNRYALKNLSTVSCSASSAR
jgi:hypothetical protein